MTDNGPSQLARPVRIASFLSRCRSVSLGKVVLAQVAIWLCVTDRCRAGDGSRDEALSLLNACLKSQARTDRVAMRVATTRDVRDSFGSWPRDQRAETYIRRDGDRFDVVQRYLFPKEDKKFKDRSTRARTVVTKGLAVTYIAPPFEDRPPSKGLVTHDWSKWAIAHGLSLNVGGPLDGYFPPTGARRAAELMAQSSDLKVRGTEAVGGTPCRVVEAKTRCGTFTLWIAASKGFHPLKATYETGPGDQHVYDDVRPLSEIEVSTPRGRQAGRSAAGVLEDVVVEKVGDAFVPVAGKFTRSEWFGDAHLFSINTYRRTEIDLNPRFEGTDAFVTDLPEGSPVSYMADQTSGVTYEWRNGKATPAGTEFGGTTPVASWGGPLPASRYLGAVLGLVLFAAGMVLAIRADRSPRQVGETTPAATGSPGSEGQV